MSDIPPDIITNLLSRLPVRSLLRFRCVSKPWCSLIDDPYFIKIHLNRSLESNFNLTLVLGGRNSLYFVDFDNPNKASELILETQFKKSLVLGSCNGLLLLQNFQGTGNNLALFNPSTRKHRVIPSPPIFFSYCFASPVDGTYGLGFDSINDDYKIISVVEFVDENRTWVGSETQIYSLKQDCWKRIKDLPYRLPCKRVWGVYVQGALHTVVKQNLDSDCPVVIVATDFNAEDYRTMQLPDFPDNNFVGMTLDKLGGCLCLHVCYREFRDDIWVMKDYGVTGSWIKLLSVAPPVIEPFVTLDTIAYSKGCDKIMMNYSDEKLVWYDLKRRTFIDIPVHGLPSQFYADVCVGSLVQLDVYGKTDKNQGAKEKVKGNKNTKNRNDFLSNGFKLKL